MPLQEVDVVPYNPEWPNHFSAICADLAFDLHAEGASYLSIEHVGSTSIPGLCAKPLIDILIVVDRFRPCTIDGVEYVDRVHYALVWGTRPGGYCYVGDGGVKNRPSFKMRREDLISRSVYLVELGSLVYRSYVDLRNTLLQDENRDLRDEYGKVKTELAASKKTWLPQEYSRGKNVIIRKILKRAGWTDEEVDQKQAEVYPLGETDWSLQPWEYDYNFVPIEYTSSTLDAGSVEEYPVPSTISTS